MICILFFDTNAVVKYFHTERGSDVVRWIVDKQLNVSISVSRRVEREFPDVIDKITQRGGMTRARADKIKLRSKRYFEKRFIIRDTQKPKIPNSISAETFKDKYELTEGKNDWDANHIACVYNHLRGAGSISTPRFVTSDRKFRNLVLKEGFTTIDPEKITIEELEHILAHEPNLVST